MNDRELKKLISKLTGVQIVRESMSQFMGQGELDKTLHWTRFSRGNAGGLPQEVVRGLTSIEDRWAAERQIFVPPEMAGDFKTSVLLWYNGDFSFDQNDLQYIDQSDPQKFLLTEQDLGGFNDHGAVAEQRKEAAKAALQFIKSKGVPLLMSPEEFRSQNKTSDRFNESYNGSEYHLNNLGWAWGAELHVLDERSPSVKTAYAMPSEVVKMFDKAGGIEAWEGRRVSEYQKSLAKKGLPADPGMTCTAAEVIIKEVAEEMGVPIYGMFFQSLREGQLIQPFNTRAVGDIMRARGVEAKPGTLVGDIESEDAQADRQAKGGIRNGMQTLRNLLNDANPGRSVFQMRDPRSTEMQQVRPGHALWKSNRYMPQGADVWKLHLRYDGGLVWQNTETRQIVPLTLEQITAINSSSKAPAGSVNCLYGAPKQKMMFQGGEDGQAAMKYRMDCALLNKARDVLRTQPNFQTTHRGVALEGYHVVMVAPYYTNPSQAEFGKSRGRLYAPDRDVGEQSELQNNDAESRQFTRKATSWQVMKNEYFPQPSRAAREGFKTFKASNRSASRSIKGQEGGDNAADGFSTLVEALNYAYSVYKLPPVAGNEVNAIQAAADALADYQKSQQDGAAQQAPAVDEGGLVLDEPAQQPALPPPAEGDGLVLDDEQPAPVGQPDQRVEVNPNARPQDNPLNLNASSVLKRLKKLG